MGKTAVELQPTTNCIISGQLGLMTDPVIFRQDEDRDADEMRHMGRPIGWASSSRRAAWPCPLFFNASVLDDSLDLHLATCTPLEAQSRQTWLPSGSWLSLLGGRH
jgi:hypothetical protein